MLDSSTTLQATTRFLNVAAACLINWQSELRLVICESASPEKANQWEYPTAPAQKAETNQDVLLANKELLIDAREIATSVSESVAQAAMD